MEQKYGVISTQDRMMGHGPQTRRNANCRIRQS
jgi:hypothetical protein